MDGRVLAAMKYTFEHLLRETKEGFTSRTKFPDLKFDKNGRVRVPSKARDDIHYTFELKDPKKPVAQRIPVLLVRLGKIDFKGKNRDPFTLINDRGNVLIRPDR